ncbi:hypothetical protein BD410DRAFT_758222 [Rickenella mellea]|uniref:Phospholipid/glycerol acyltransferase domain-containing protein n=1 Tax=Rickenella mellea TaxID=50990 RepID=A0A4R5XE96_9AGAM|nr:hypothetical protein BD410DRAFT_758222 [Rickenella mellea]
MEKYSAFRDPGTGIQPFLTPVPPKQTLTILNIFQPVGIILGLARVILVLILTLVYTLTVHGVFFIFTPVPPLYRFATRFATAVVTRLVLLVSGFWWIHVESANRKRGRGDVAEKWNPGSGDIIVSNCVSWVELLWLAFRFDPVFVVPVTSPAIDNLPSGPLVGKRTTSRQSSSSFDKSSTASSHVDRSEILGFTTLSLLQMIHVAGHVPPYLGHAKAPKTLEEIRQKAKRPIVIFPECTTSNGRGLLRFAEVFKSETVPVVRYKLFLMCVRIDPPTKWSPSIAIPIPSGGVINPLLHLFKLSSSFAPHTLVIRLLAQSESPSTGTFVVSDVIKDTLTTDDVLSEVCATLISNAGRMKRLGLRWEDKAKFLEFYATKKYA